MIPYTEFGDTDLYPEPPLVIPAGSFEGTPEELRAVLLEQIEQYPNNFGMACWVDGWNVHSSTDPELAQDILAKDGKTACGTTLCLAGYAALFVDGKVGPAVAIRAQDLLGLQNQSLFYMSDYDAKESLREIVEQDKRKIQAA